MSGAASAGVAGAGVAAWAGASLESVAGLPASSAAAAPNDSASASKAKRRFAIMGNSIGAKPVGNVGDISRKKRTARPRISAISTLIWTDPVKSRLALVVLIELH